MMRTNIKTVAREFQPMSSILLIVITIVISTLIAAWADRWKQNPALFWFVALFFAPFAMVNFVDISPYLIFAGPVISAAALVLLDRSTVA
jgi:hypothetical protein